MEHRQIVVNTPRLRLFPAEAADLRAQMGGSAPLAVRLGVRVATGWPLPELADAQPWFLEKTVAAGGFSPWLVWYAVLTRAATEKDFALALRPDEEGILAGSGGFLGAPAQDGPEAGCVEIGYALAPEFRGHGVAFEMVRGLCEWAFSQTLAEVRKIRARTEPGNAASVALLSRLGFHLHGCDAAGCDLYVLHRTLCNMR